MCVGPSRKDVHVRNGGPPPRTMDFDTRSESRKKAPPSFGLLLRQSAPRSSQAKARRSSYVRTALFKGVFCKAKEHILRCTSEDGPLGYFRI